MGFGFMFLGCVLLAETAGTELFGFALLFYGMKVAGNYCTCFEKARKLCFVGMAVCAVKLANQLAGMLGAELLTGMAANIFASVYTVFMVVFYVVFFMGIAKIAGDTGLSSIRAMAYSNAFLSALFMIASRVCYAMVSFTSADFLGEHKAQVLGTAMLLPIVVMILAAVLVFRCYMHICIEGDEDMSESKSRFKSPFEYYEKDKYKRNTKPDVNKKGHKR